MALVKSKQLDLSNDFAFTGAVSLTTAPTSGNDVANKTYVDSKSSTGLDFKQSVLVASTENIGATYANGVLTGSANGALTIDDQSVSAGASEALSTRVLLKDQTTASHNGIYYCTQTGDASNPFKLTRATDADSSSEINTGCFVFVEAGTDNQNKAFVLQANANGSNPVLDTNDLNFIQFSGAGQITAGDGLSKSGDTLSADLGLGLDFATGSIQVQAGAGITVDANGVNSALPQLDSGSPGSDLSADGSATGITIGDTPPGDSNVRVTVNGVGVELKGDKTGDAYFSSDAGTTARALADIASGDQLIWNGASSYILETTCLVEIFYSA